MMSGRATEIRDAERKEWSRIAVLDFQKLSELAASVKEENPRMQLKTAKEMVLTAGKLLDFLLGENLRVNAKILPRVDELIEAAEEKVQCFKSTSDALLIVGGGGIIIDEALKAMATLIETVFKDNRWLGAQEHRDVMNACRLLFSAARVLLSAQDNDLDGWMEEAVSRCRRGSG